MTPINGQARPVSKQLSVLLTNPESRLVKAAIAVTEAKERHLDDKPLWRPMHNLWEREVKRACPAYRPFKSDYFGTVCDSGREGATFCGDACRQCQFYSAFADPVAKAHSDVDCRVPGCPRCQAKSASVVPVAVIKAQAAQFAAQLTPPAPVASCENVAALEIELDEALQIVETLAQACIETINGDAQEHEHCRACLRDGLEKASAVTNLLTDAARRGSIQRYLAEFVANGIA